MSQVSRLSRPGRLAAAKTAGIVKFLCSDATAFITGQTIIVDSGAMAQVQGRAFTCPLSCIRREAAARSASGLVTMGLVHQKDECDEKAVPLVGNDKA